MILLIIILQIFSQIKSHLSEFDSVKNLEITDSSHTLMLDGFPVCFGCTFTVFNQTFSFFFSRHHDLHKPELSKSNLHRSFKSSLSNETNLKAECTLILNFHAYNILSNTEDKDSRRLRFLDSNKNNLKQIYHLTRNIENVSSSMRLETKLETPSFGLSYLAARRFHRHSRARKSKRSFSFKSHSEPPILLTVETCVHVHPNTMALFMKALVSDDKKYIEMYLMLYFAERLRNIDKVYQTIGREEFFRIRVVLNEVVAHFKYDNQIPVVDDVHNTYRAHGNTFVNRVNNYMNENYAHRKSFCDHTFLVHSYSADNIVGEAFVGYVCNDLSTSVILFKQPIDVIMAHELGHNLGSNHDVINFNCPPYAVTYLMHPFAGETRNNLELSSCTVRQLRNSLFLSNGRLKNNFACLINKVKLLLFTQTY